MYCLFQVLTNLEERSIKVVLHRLSCIDLEDDACLECCASGLKLLCWRRQARKRSQSAKRARDSEQEESISHDENDPGIANQATSKTRPRTLQTFTPVPHKP